MARKSGDRYSRYILGGIVVTVILLGLILWGPLERLRKQQPGKQPPPAAKKQAHEERQKREPAERKALVAVIIDDLGQDLATAREVLSLPAKVTLAVMPGLPSSKRTAELGREKGRDVLLHLPMEARDNGARRQAPGILRADMTPQAFMATLAGNIDSVPGAVGVNNHEGSALTENREAMKFLMAELKARNLRFVDSLTGSGSIAYAVAREFGVKAAKRDVFLDNDSDNPEAIRRQFEELGRIARKNGRAIGIGHPHPATLNELRRWIAASGANNIEIVPVSKLMN